jgi:hypothetical protein
MGAFTARVSWATLLIVAEPEFGPSVWVPRIVPSLFMKVTVPEGGRNPLPWLALNRVAKIVTFWPTPTRLALAARDSMELALSIRTEKGVELLEA